MSSDAVFVADSVTKSFGAQRVLHSASLWARAGELTVLVGINGSGKSTLLRCATGLLSAESGTVRFAGQVYTRPRLEQLARAGLFYMSQELLLSPAIPVRTQLEGFAAMFASDFDAVVDLLELRDVLEQWPITLSGGERRRIDIAAALLRRPRCLLADEPLAKIDPRDRDLVTRAFRMLADGGTAVVFTGHEVEDVLSAADHVIWVTAGTTHSLGSGTAAREHHAFRREYLGLTDRKSLRIATVE